MNLKKERKKLLKQKTYLETERNHFNISIQKVTKYHRTKIKTKNKRIALPLINEYKEVKKMGMKLINSLI